MIKINNIILQTDIETILSDLKTDLYKRGIIRFNSIKSIETNIQCTCPFHSQGQERKPSFGIQKDTGICHCFSCNYSGTISKMISNLYGYSGKEFGEKWLIQRYNSLEIENRKILFNAEREIAKPKEINYISEEELDKYRYIHPYMYKRGLTDEIIEMLDIGYDKDSECLTFPVKDINGNVVFVARRSVNTKYFNYPNGVDKPVYCAEMFKDGKYKEAYIVESFLNCATLWKLGIPSMALIGTGSTSQYKILQNLPIRSYVLALDPDKAGQSATERFKQNIKNKIIKTVKYEEHGKDINDLQDSFLKLKIEL